MRMINYIYSKPVAHTWQRAHLGSGFRQLEQQVIQGRILFPGLLLLLLLLLSVVEEWFVPLREVGDFLEAAALVGVVGVTTFEQKLQINWTWGKDTTEKFIEKKMKEAGEYRDWYSWTPLLTDPLLTEFRLKHVNSWSLQPLLFLIIAIREFHL